MTGRATLLGTVALVGVLSACGDDAGAPDEVRQDEARQEEPTPRRHQGGTPNPHASQPLPDALARVASGGERGRAFDAGAVVHAGTAAIALDLREGARVSVEAGARVRLLDEAPSQIAIAEGLVHVVLPPMGGSPRPPLRVGTPSGTLRLNGSGDAWALVFPDGRAWFALTGGLGQVLVERETGVEAVDLHAGQALVAGASEPTPGPEGEAAARAAAAALLAAATGAPPSEGVLQEALVKLDEAIRSTQEDYARGAALQEAHRVASEAGDGHEALQAIVHFSQETRVRRDALLLVYERARSIALLRATSPDPVALRRRGVREALRLSSADDADADATEPSGSQGE